MTQVVDLVFELREQSCVQVKGTVAQISGDLACVEYSCFARASCFSVNNDGMVEKESPH
jgi:hypothetical protein